MIRNLSRHCTQVQGQTDEHWQADFAQRCTPLLPITLVKLRASGTRKKRPSVEGPAGVLHGERTWTEPPRRW